MRETIQREAWHVSSDRKNTRRMKVYMQKTIESFMKNINQMLMEIAHASFVLRGKGYKFH